MEPTHRHGDERRTRTRTATRRTTRSDGAKTEPNLAAFRSVTTPVPSCSPGWAWAGAAGRCRSNTCGWVRHERESVSNLQECVSYRPGEQLVAAQLLEGQGYGDVELRLRRDVEPRHVAYEQPVCGRPKSSQKRRSHRSWACVWLASPSLYEPNGCRVYPQTRMS